MRGSTFLPRSLSTAAVTLASLLLAFPALADCRTSNCSQNNARHSECEALAAPRIPTVLLTVDFIFVPDLPRVEGGQRFCVKWEADAFGFVHTSTADACFDFDEVPDGADFVFSRTCQAVPTFFCSIRGIMCEGRLCPATDA